MVHWYIVNAAWAADLMLGWVSKVQSIPIGHDKQGPNTTESRIAIPKIPGNPPQMMAYESMNYTWYVLGGSPPYNLMANKSHTGLGVCQLC